MLAARAAAGDVGAFTELVRRHEGRVRGFLARFCEQDADDLSQETFVRAWRMAGSFRSEGSYQGWLLKIAWRLFLSGRKNRKESSELRENLICSEVDPAAAIDVNRALALLDERERAAALLCFRVGHSHVEAADILGLPLGTLKSIIARAKAQLASHLGVE